MVRKAKKPVFEEKAENHMQVFERLARVKNMHGHPGERKKKGGGK